MRFKPPSHLGEGSPLPWVCGKKTPLNILSRSRHIQQTSVSARRIRILLLKRFLRNWLITLLFLLDPFIESIPCHGPNPVIGPDSYKRREDIDKYFQVRREIQLATVGNTIWLGGQKYNRALPVLPIFASSLFLAHKIGLCHVNKYLLPKIQFFCKGLL